MSTANGAASGRICEQHMSAANEFMLHCIYLL